MNSKLKLFFVTVIAAMFICIICGGTLIASAETAETTTENPATAETDGVENGGEENDELAPPAELSGETEEETPATPPADTEVDTEEDTEIENVAANFVEWLKATFGADYEYYYNQIIDNWGSIENYLLQFGEENIPEEYQTGWNEFIAWITKYAVIWAPVLAVALVILVWIVGKKVFASIVKKVVDSKISAVGIEMNKQSKALTSIIRSQKAMFGTNEKFADNVKELDESEKELNA